jgi:surfeit locus 1 family protein
MSLTEERRASSVLWPALAAIVAFAILVGLGTWQMARLSWKEGLIRAIAERSTAAPVEAPAESEWAALTKEEVEYRRVSVEGSFLQASEVRVFTDLPRTKGPARGIGYWVLTPLVRDDGSVIIVNRGFVPIDRADPASRREGQVEGRVKVTGLIRWAEERNLFTPSDDPRAGRWFTRDPAAIAAAAGLRRVAPFTVDAEASAPGGLPQGGETRLVLSNRHLEYARTWYGLALGLVIVTVAYLSRGRGAARLGA